MVASFTVFDLKFSVELLAVIFEFDESLPSPESTPPLLTSIVFFVDTLFFNIVFALLVIIVVPGALLFIAVSTPPFSFIKVDSAA